MANQNERIIPGCKVMSKDGFWNLNAEVKAACGQDQEKYMDTLTARLKELGPKYAQDFHDIVHSYEDLAYKYGLWSAAGLISYTSDDGFIDFRAWLISKGREAYYAALKNPDSLADLDPGDGYWFESFTYAGDSALEELTGESAYDHTDRAAYEKMIEALKADIDYGEGINYPYESEEIADYFPRLYERYMHSSGEFIYEGSWNYNDPEIIEARQAGPPPKPEKTMEMVGCKMIFRNDNHGVLFEKEIRYHKGCSRKMAAALFLLTADTRLWHQAENHIGASEIDIAAVKPRRLDAMAYVCYALARDIVTGSKTVALTDLADPSLLSPRYFLVIQTAMLIRGYGLSAANRLLFTEGRNQDELRQE